MFEPVLVGTKKCEGLTIYCTTYGEITRHQDTYILVDKISCLKWSVYELPPTLTAAQVLHSANI
jgi:hypothetical protein